MATQTFSVSWRGSAPPGGILPTIGDEWKIYLDQSLFTADVSKPIIGTYNATLPQDDCEECKDITIYQISYDDSDLPTGRTDLTSCDVQDLQPYTEADKTAEANRLRIFAESRNDLLKEAIAAIPQDQFNLVFSTAQMTQAGFYRLNSGNRYWVRTTGETPIELF